MIPGTSPSTTPRRMYVVDHGDHRVQRFDADGWVDASFWATMGGQSHAPAEPVSLAMLESHGEPHILVLDRAVGTVLFYRADGQFDAERSAGWLALNFPSALGLAAAGDLVYVGDNAAQVVRAFLLDGRPLGEVGGYHGPIAGLASRLRRPADRSPRWWRPGRSAQFHPPLR